MNTSLVALTSLLLLGLLGVARAATGEAELQIDSYFGTTQVLASFGYASTDSFAELTISARPEDVDLPLNISVVASTAAEYKAFTSGHTYRLCISGTAPERWPVFLSQSVNKRTLRLTNFTSGANQYYFLIVQCGSSFQRRQRRYSTPIHVQYTFLNGDSQLSLGDVGAPASSAVFIFLWLALLVYWIAIMVVVTPRKTPLHFLIGVWLIVKFLQVVFMCIYWNEVATSGNINSPLKHVYLCGESLGDTFLFSVLLAVSKGWKLTRKTLAPHEWRTGGLAMGCMLSLLLFFVFYSSTFFFSFSLWLLIACLFLLPRVLAFTTENKRLLDNYYQALHGAELPGRLRDLVRPVQIKCQFYSRLRVVTMAFITSVLIVTAVRAIVFDWKLQWLGLFFEDFVDWLISFVLILCLLPPKGAREQPLRTVEPYTVEAILSTSIIDARREAMFYRNPVEFVRELVANYDREARVNELLDDILVCQFPPFRDDLTPHNANLSFCVAVRRANELDGVNKSDQEL